MNAKKLLSTVLALVMAWSTLTLLAPMATAESEESASTTKTVYSQNFDSLTESTNDAAVLSAIGWSQIERTATTYGSAIVPDGEGKVLRLTTGGSGTRSFTVIEDDALKNDYVITYDFKYANSGGTAGETAQFMGYNDVTNATGTWHVQPRLGGNFLNGYRLDNGTWGVTNMTQNSQYISGTDVIGVWYTLRIEVSFDHGVSVYMKPRTDTETDWTQWGYTSVYDASMKTVSKTLDNFLSGAIGFRMGVVVDVYLDNIRIEAQCANSPVSEWDFENVTMDAIDSTNVASAMNWTANSVYAPSTTTAAITADPADGTNDCLRLYNHGAAETCTFKILSHSDLTSGFTLECDFYYEFNLSNETSKGLVFMGYGEGGNENNTWHVQPRLNGHFLNGFKTTSWTILTDPAWNTNGAIGEWYSIQIVMDPTTCNVTAKAKLKADTTDWSNITGSTYTNAMKADAANVTNFNSGAVYLKVRAGISVLLDNLTVTNTSGTTLYAWDDGINSVNVADALQWTESANYNASTATAAIVADPTDSANSCLEIHNGGTAQACTFKVDDHEDLKMGFTLEYDFYYSGYTNSAEAAEFTGHSEDTSTWHVQPRPNTYLIHGIKTSGNSWDTSAKGDTTWAGETGKWYTVQIVMNPNVDAVEAEDAYGVTTRMKPRGTTEWTTIAYYSQSQKSVATALGENYFKSGCIYLKVRAGITVLLDNVTVTYTGASWSAPCVYGYQAATMKKEVAGGTTVTVTTNALRLIGVIDQYVYENAREVGFKVMLVKTDNTRAVFTQKCRYVYNQLTYDSNVVTAGSLVGGGKYLYALRVNNLPAEALTWTVTPYYVDKTTGNTVWGTPKTFAYTSPNSSTTQTLPTT